MEKGEFLQKFSRKILIQGGDWKTAKTYCNNISQYMKAKELSSTDVLVQDHNSIGEYILELKETGLSASYINSFIAAIKRLYKINGKYYNVKRLEYHENKPKTPNVLTWDECMKMCNAEIYLKHRVIINLLFYGALRRSELINLKLNDFSENLRVTIIQSKYKKSRVITIPQHVYDLVNKYINEAKPKIYLLNGEKGTGMYSAKSIENVVKNTAVLVGIKKHVNPHLLRSSWATSMLDNGASDMYVSEMLGHEKIQTTRDYYARLTVGGMQFNFNNIYNKMLSK